MRQLKPKIAHFLRFNLAKFKFRYLIRYRYYILPFVLVLITVSLTTLAIATPTIQSYLTNGSSSSTLLSNSVLVISLSVLLTVGTSLYFWIDYQQHNIPLKQADPKVHYSFKHHLSVVTLPLLRFKWKPLAYAMATSTLTVIALVGTLYVSVHNVQAATSISVSINQKPGTADPNPSYTSVFEVVFSEAIDKTTFTSADITLTGSAPGQTVQSITEAGSFNKTTYEVRIAATGSGTITPTISQDLISALNIPTDTNQNSTSTDNTVTYNGTLAPSEFVTTWKTDNPGVSNSNQITIPTTGGGYNYNVDWGDGNTSTGQTGNSTHTYASAGTYTVKITGTFLRIYFANIGDRQKILSVEQWGNRQWGSTLEHAFRGTNNLQIPAIDAPDLTNTLFTGLMFSGASALNSNINHWDVSNVTDMTYLFGQATSFNQPLNNWDTSSVTNMSSMFEDATSFNQPLNNWDTSSVTNMSAIFQGTTSFNQPLNNWNTSNVTDMSGMFFSATAFNSSINTWDTTNVTSLSQMFAGATAFSQPINSWNTSNVVFYLGTFFTASAFNQPLNNWDISGADSLQLMFAGASAFNQPLAAWNVSNITNMAGTFAGASAFDQSLAGWNVSNVTDMTDMFGDANGYFVDSSGLSTANYDATIIAWNNLTLQNTVPFDAGTSKYCNAGAQRTSIITTFSWTINDSGLDCTVSYAPNEFVTTWKTDNPGSSASNQITIPTTGGGYNYSVNWGDGNTSTGQTGNATHTYASAGTYTVKITGTFPRIYFNTVSNDRLKILTIEQWGTNPWSSMDSAFAGTSNIAINATDTPDLNNVTNMRYMFANAFISTGSILMLGPASTLNANLNNWDVSHVTNMQGLFLNLPSYNQPLNNWDVSHVTNISNMFYYGNSFNQPLNSWDVSSVTEAYSVFSGAGAFDQPLNNWDVSSVTNMTSMFESATSFNQPLNSWDVSNVTDMGSMFVVTTAFNQPLNSWDVSNVTDMSAMFYLATSFNQPLNNWDVSNVTDMSVMFGAAVDFDRSLEDWDVSNVTTMEQMLGYGSGISVASYDATLIAWNNLSLQNDVTFDAGTSEYCNAEAQRANIISAFSWTINDGGENPTCNTTGYAPEEFVTTWKTDNPGVTSSNQIRIPTFPGDTYNYSVDWGDGNTSTGQNGDSIHTYASAGTYTVKITGTFPRIYTNNNNDRQKILTVEQWGNNPWTSLAYAFFGASNLQIPATDSPNTTNVNDMSGMFYQATLFNSDISDWDVSSVTNMYWMFADATSFNQPLNNWDVSNVSNMYGLFIGATSFNSSIENWNVSNVTDMTGMFMGATSFNQPLNNWNIGSVNLSNIFANASSFNQPLNNWNTSNVTSMPGVFVGATSFNQSLASWNVSNVVDMLGMFAGASSFNQSLASWNVSNVVDMTYMFGNVGGALASTSGLSTPNYDATLIAWNNRTLQNLVTFDAGTSQYCNAEVERANIISSFSWTINDAGLNCTAVPLTVTLNQATGQDDPTTTNPVNFTAVFSEAIDPSSFTASDIYNSNGNATVGTPTTTDNVTWNIPVTMSRSGTVSVELAAGAVMTVEGTYNETATYTDNSVTYETAQTDFSLTKTLTTPGPIRSGNSVTYHFKITNQGPNDSTYGGAIYDVLPAEFSFSTNSNSSVACMDMGIAEDMGEPYFATFYPGRHLLACMPTVGEVLNTGSSVEFDITGTATTDFTSNVTQNKSIYFDFDNEKAFGDVLEGTLVNNIDFTTLPYNNVSNVTYVYSPNTPNPTPTPTPTPTPNPTPTPTPTPTPNPTPTPTPTSTPKTTTITTPPANGSSPGSPITKNIQYVADRGVLGKRSVGVLPMPLYNFVHQVSDSAAISISWLLLLILLILATFYGWKAYTQYRANQLLITALTRLRNTKQATDTYLQITNHYLNTPVAIMSGAVELLASLNKLSKPSIDHLQSIVAKYKTAVEALAIDGEAAIVDAPTMAPTDVQPIPTNYFSDLFATVPQSGSALKQRAVYLPLAIVGGIYVLVTFMFANAQVYQLSPVQLGLHLMCLLLSGFLLATTFRQRDLQRVAQQVTQRAIDIEQKLISERTAFIDRASKILSDHYETLSITCRNLGTLPEAKTLLNGLAMLGDTAKSLSNVSRLSHLSTDAPNSKLELDIPKLLMPLQSLASAKQLTLTTHIPPNLSLNIQPEELQQLIQSTVTNAIQFSPTNTTVDVAAQQKGKNILLTITDNGSGIAPEKLDQLFQPFTRGTETETYDHPGLGLNLHVDKLITEKLGGSIQLTSTTAPATTTGTSIIISLPACKSGLRPAPVMIVPGA